MPKTLSPTTPSNHQPTGGGHTAAAVGQEAPHA